MPFLDETGVQNMTADIKTLADARYLKLGDNLTGDLTIEKNTQGFLTFKNTSLSTRAQAASLQETQSIGGLHWRDSNDELNGYLEIKRAYDTNNSYLQLNLRRYDSTGQQYANNGFTIQINDNLEPSVTFPSTESRKAWCIGLGVGQYVSKIVGTSGTQSVAHNTVVNLTNIALDPGVWVITGRISYVTGGTASGFRSCLIGDSTSTANYAIQQLPGATGGNTVVNAVGLVTLSAASTVYLNAKQYSGGALNVTKNASYIQAVRIRADV